MRFRGITKAAAALSLGALALTACSGTDAESDGDISLDSVHIMYTAFDEGVAATFLWKHILEEQGYDAVIFKSGETSVCLGGELCVLL